jgi:arabinofuranosyltransferase
MMISPDLAIEAAPAPHAVAGTDPALVDAAAAPDAVGGGPGPHRGLQVAVLALPVVVLAVLAWVHRSMFYDGYIYLHVVQNILAGHGPVFNAGQRVEAFTSPAWTALVALVALVTPFSLTAIAVDLGIALTLGGLVLAVASSARLVRRASPDAYLLPIGAVAFVAVPAVWSLASLGMETGLSFFWLGACLALLVRWAGRRGPAVSIGTLVVLGIGPLVRPELGLDSLVFVGVLLVVDRDGRTWRGNARILAWAAALPLTYQVFRMGYYGMVVANTAVAKEASLSRLGRGVQYFMDFAGTYWMVIPAVCLAVGAFPPLAGALMRTDRGTRNLAVLFALPTAGALNAAYIVVMGGDYVHARLFMAPLFALVAPVAVVPLGRRYVISLLVIPWALLCSFGLGSTDGQAFSLSPFLAVNGHGNVNPTVWAWTSQAAFADPATGDGAWLQFDASKAPVRLQAPAAPGLRTPVIATAQIGDAPYELGPGVQILDLLGLADPLTAHLQLTHRGQFTGHEKPLPTPWVMALLTAPGSSTVQIGDLQFNRPSAYTALIPQVTGRALAIQTAWARAALSCPAIHSIEYGPNRPLTVGSFISNMVHSMSQTTVRIPPDPETAYHRFCGPGVPAPVTLVMAQWSGS